jgi:HSP20 family protein
MNTHSTLARCTNGATYSMKQRATITPQVDVYENAEELLLVADMPGATADAIDVQIEKGQLTVQAKRPDDSGGSPLAAEYRPSDYLRVFSIPQGIDGSKIDAQWSAGVLRLRLPKTDAVKPRRIEVKSG